MSLIKELLVTIGLVMLGAVIAMLILSNTGIMGAIKDLFINQITFIAD